MSKEGKKPFYKKIWVWVLIVLVIAVGANMGKGSKNDDQASGDSSSTATSSATDSSKKNEDSKINYDNFVAIKMGQSYDEVVAVLGEGKEDSSSEVAGIKSTIYSWNGSGLANMNVTIQNGVVTGKAQAGLKKAEGNNVTLEKYNQVNTGCSYNDAAAVLGEGQLTSETKIMDTDVLLYSFVNKDGSNATLTFNGGVLQDKAQFNLK